jgi:DNA-binding MarR family transcriptional regulator
MSAADDLPARVADRPTWLISRVAGRAHAVLAKAFAAAGVRGYHYRVLAALEEAGPASQAALGRRTLVDRSDVVAVLADLEARGWVRRAPDAADRRRNVVTITAAGRRGLRRLDERVAGAQEELLAPLSSRQRAQLTRLLAALAA